eukprot:scaffold17654_cov161-Skeletonema_marinoi.AAC.1
MAVILGYGHHDLSHPELLHCCAIHRHQTERLWLSRANTPTPTDRVHQPIRSQLSMTAKTHVLSPLSLVNRYVLQIYWLDAKTLLNRDPNTLTRSIHQFIPDPNAPSQSIHSDPPCEKERSKIVNQKGIYYDQSLQYTGRGDANHTTNEAERRPFYFTAHGRHFLDGSPAWRIFVEDLGLAESEYPRVLLAAIPNWTSSGHLRGCSMADIHIKSMSSGIYPSVLSQPFIMGRYKLFIRPVTALETI